MFLMIDYDKNNTNINIFHLKLTKYRTCANKRRNGYSKFFSALRNRAFFQFLFIFTFQDLILNCIVCLYVCLPLPWPYSWTDFQTKGLAMTRG